MSLFAYDKSLKSARSDELINTYVMRPIAGLLVRVLYPTPVTPNVVTVAATLSGLVAAAFYAPGGTTGTLAGAIFLWVKDLLDSADGQLARAKGMYSRAGRFLDSVGDLLVNASVFAAIAHALYLQTLLPAYFVFAAAAFLCTTLRISYHVFYQVSFLHLENSYALNRTNEAIQQVDLLADRFTLVLQRVYQFFYGWQDRAMLRLDSWCRKDLAGDLSDLWYGDRTGLRLSGLLGMGTEIFVLVVFSLCDRLEMYLYVNLIIQNGVWLASVAYRRFVLAPSLQRPGPGHGSTTSSNRV